MSYKDSDFMSELEAAAHMRPSKPTVIALLTIIALLAFAIIWACVSKVEEVTRGSGQIVPSQEIQVVQSLEGGILQELLVRVGELVSEGQVLLRISDVQSSSEERGTQARFLGLQAKKARLEAEASGKEFVVPEDVAAQMPQIAENERALHESRQKELAGAYAMLDDKISKAEAEIAEVSAQMERLTQNRKLLQQELDITKEMVRQRAAPKLEEIRIQRELGDISGQINAYSQQRMGLEAELRGAKQERETQGDKFRSQALGELNEVETQISGLKENLKSIGDRVDRAEVRSPVEGIINNITITTIGGVIEPAMRLVEIVPVDDELKIIARVSPSEVAFIRPGQKAKVKITAYDSQKYGALDGELVRIGANSVTDREGNIFFEIEVRTERNYMGPPEHKLPITPGMVAQVEIITGKRTIIEYLMKPILRARERALTER